MDWIAVFRTGTHTDSRGTARTWTGDDLDHIVSSYNPAEHEAPIVIGHPEDNAPAWGWVEGLKRVGDVLYAKATSLVPEFVDMVKRGMFKKRSIALYADGTLRHIGFLGAEPPAVKGLPDIAFRDADDATIWEFNEPIKKEGTMRFLEWLKQLANREGVQLDDLPASFSEGDLQKQIDAARKDERDKASAEFNEELKKKETEFATREAKLREGEQKAQRSGIASFCEALCREGKLTPAMMKHGMGMENFLTQISTITTGFEFGEGADKKKQTPLEFMQSFLKGLPKQIEFREVATDKSDPGPRGQATERLEALIREKMKSDPKMTYGAAFSQVQVDEPDLAQEYINDIKKGE